MSTQGTRNELQRGNGGRRSSGASGASGGASGGSGSGEGRRGGDFRLPFQPRRGGGDWSDWVFRHRIGLLITIVIYLSLAIIFVSYRIVVMPVVPATVTVELEDESVEEVISEREEIEEMERVGGEEVRNRVSNDDSKFDESLRDSKNSNASEIYEEAERMQRELAESREAYERSLREIEDNSQRVEKENISSKQGDRNQDSFVRGGVTTAFNLAGRTAVYIDIPAYKCEGGGQVLVNISVNRNGRVVSAQVEKATSTSDRCLMSEAISSARASRFSTSSTADDPQRGTILYTFIAQ
ncbi:MAG: energy transducer TonB [Rikenellaceae bacterium]